MRPSQSDLSSPYFLVPKLDGTFCMYADYRKVYSMTITYFFPVPRVDNCIDNIGHAKYVTKFDLLQGFWRIALTDTAKKIYIFYNFSWTISIQSYALWNEKLVSNFSTSI